MPLNKGIATGFMAGLAVAGLAVLVLRDDARGEQDRARAGALKAQVDRLESEVTKLSTLVNEARSSTTASNRVPPGVAAPQAPAASKERNQAQVQALADADALVELGFQSGRWTPAQQAELSAAVTELDVQEQGRILARVTKAINDGQLQFDPRH